MGSSNYDDGVYTARMSYHKDTGTDAFVHTDAIASGAVAAEVHEALNPKKLNKAGENIRESLDSEAHPNSLPIVVPFDVTGSMGGIPRVFVEKLGKLMALLTTKWPAIKDPQLLFAAIGDAKSDQAPIQVGQFESGNEMDDALTKIYIEQGGGGTKSESYELFAYYMARHSRLDSLRKRGQKGFLFLTGDELPYRAVSHEEVSKWIGDKLQSDIRFSSKDPRNDKDGNALDGDILAELQQQYEVFWIYPKEGSYSDDSFVVGPLKAIFGQRFLWLEHSEDICELIATTVGLEMGYSLDEIATDLTDIGADKDAVSRAGKALTAYAGSKSITKTAEVTGELATTDAVSGVGRL